jgi:hypothetical protein
MTAVRIWFQENEILIDTIPSALVAGSLTATLSDAGIVSITRIQSSFSIAAVPWAQVADRTGATFDTPDAVMAYLAGQFTMRRPVGGVVNLMAGLDLGGHKALMFAEDGSGWAVYADPTVSDYTFAGVSLGAAAAGSTVQAVVSGLVAEPSWAWAPLQPVYVGLAGALTQAAPTTGLFHLIGFAPSTTSLLVAPGPLVQLA